MRIHRAAVGALTLSLMLFVGSAVGAQEEAPPDRGKWELVGELDLARSGHTATLLAGDAILVVGGYNNQGKPVLTAEVVYPASGATRPAGTLPWGLSGHQAQLLSDGRVLLSGSDSFDDRGFPTDEDHCADYPPLLWDPHTLDFEATTGIDDSNGASATRLADGRVLVAGGGTACEWGRGVVGFDAAHVWNPVSGELADTDSLTSLRAFHPAVQLDDGRVLVAGGTRLAFADDLGSSVSLVSLESWDPETGAWTAHGDSGLAPTGLALLDDGRVAVTGYDKGTGIGLVRLFDPADDSMVAIADDWPTPLTEAAVAPFAGGRLLLVGGLNEDGRPVPSALSWDPASGDRTRIKYPKDGADVGHTATSLSDGTIIVIGGRDEHRDGRILASVEALQAVR